MFGKRLTTTALVATFALGATALPSLARNGDGPMGPARADRGFIYLLKTSDANKDGKITKDEVVAFQNGRFEEIDVDSDGIITPGEFETFHKARMDAFMKANPRPQGQGGPQGKMAANGDGPARPGPNGKMANADGPGGPNAPGKPHRMAMNGDGHHGWNRDMHRAGWDDHHRNWGKPQRGGMERIFFVRADTDKSGQVSAAEFQAVADRMFTRMDTNSDMVITVDDLPNMPMQ